MADPDLQPTGERFLPDHYGGQVVHAEHLARYRLAAQLAPGATVLDVACGEGYGSAMLAAAGAAAVSAVDLDPATVAHARERYGVDAQAADVAALPFDDDAFDLVVSFETIEHVPDAERALDELARVRAPAGLLLISTPVAGQYQVDNEFHVREFGHDEFARMLGERFPAVRLLYQHNWTTSAVLGEEDLTRADGATAVDVELTKVHGTEPGGELYLLALCGEEVDVTLRQVAVSAGTDEAHELALGMRESAKTQEHLAREHEKVSAVLAEVVATRERMERSLSWRITRPLRAAGRLRRGR